MPAPLADSLLTLAASIDGDGGHAVCRTLASLLRDVAPFDAGEVVLRQAQGFHRFPLAGDERRVAGDDIVTHVLANAAPRRLDDQRDLDAFPETGDLMARSGLKSALVLPLGTSPRGVLIVARRHGWAFVGASLHFLGPLSAMAGLALDRSLALTALGHPAGGEAGAEAERRDMLRHEGATLVGELQRLRAQSVESVGEIESLRSTLAVARDELADSRGATIAAQSALDQAVSHCHELQARLDRRERGGTGEGGGEDAPAEAATEAAILATEAAIAEPPAATLAPVPAPARRARRRRRGAFEPPGGPGAA
jgi:hypothetical protein